MSYSIHYGPDTPRSAPKKKGYAGLVGAVLIIMVCAIAVGWAIPRQTKQFVQALFPWSRGEVRSAFADLREDVKEGQSLSDAITTFCREVIHEAEQSQ